MVLPKVWGVIPGLPILEPVQNWISTRIIKLALANAEENPSLAPTSDPVPRMPINSEIATPSATSAIESTAASAMRAMPHSVASQPAEPVTPAAPPPATVTDGLDANNTLREPRECIA